MARFDLYRAEGPGYLLDVQTDLLDGLNTRVVVPVLPADRAPKPAQLLNPVVAIEGEDHVLVTQFLAAVPLSHLKLPAGTLRSQADDITRALDMVFQGF